MVCYGDLQVMQIERNEQSVRQAIPFRMKTLCDNWGTVGSNDSGGDADDSAIRACVSMSVACIEWYKQIFYSLTFTASSPLPPTSPRSSLTSALQSQSPLATTETQTVVAAMVEMQLIQSSPHIRLSYSGFFLSCMSFIVRSVHRVVAYKQIFIA